MTCGEIRAPSAFDIFKQEKPMSRIVHIAIKVDDLEKSTKFYEDVFGI